MASFSNPIAEARVNADYDIVQVVGQSTAVSQALARRPIPGSILLAYDDLPDGTCSVDFEGGLYSRDRTVPPTRAQQVDYAVRAGSRAALRMDTVARLTGVPRADLATIGVYHGATAAVEWFPTASAAEEAPAVLDSTIAPDVPAAVSAQCAVQPGAGFSNPIAEARVNADYDIVEVIDITARTAKILSRRAAPGSILIAHDDQPDGTCIVDFEGGIYSRDRTVAPTAEEQRLYAVRAAGRAALRMDTMARVEEVPRLALRTLGVYHGATATIEWNHARTETASCAAS